MHETAVMAIFVGMLADGLDGRVARLTNTQSEFGAQYDSLSDMVTFGVAPAILAYTWGLEQLGKLGWLAAFIYTASVALRLARFNSQHDDSKLLYFTGLACPIGAGVVSSFVGLMTHLELVAGIALSVCLALLMIALAILMVSNIRYPSFKRVDFKGKVPFRYILLVVVTVVAIAIYPPLVLLVAFISYVLMGIVFEILRVKKIRGRVKSRRNKKTR